MIGTVHFVLCFHFHTSNSSINDIVNSETIIVNNVSKSSSEKYSSNDIVNSVFSTTVNNVSLSIIEEQQKNSLSIFNSEMITVNNVIQANDDTEYKPVTLVGLHHLTIELYDHCSMITVNNASKTPSKDYDGHSYSMMDSYSSSTNDIVSSETITVNNASKTQSEDYDEHSCSKMDSSSSSTNGIVNSETITVNNVIEANNATKMAVTFVGLNPSIQPHMNLTTLAV